jgi:Protein of unknown function (DUF2917)
MYVYGRDRASELTRLARSIRTEKEITRLEAKAMEPARSTPRPTLTAARDGGNARATLVMERGEVLSIRVGRRPYRIDCVAGRLWATMDGSTVDSVLLAGHHLVYRGTGRVVIQALRTATVRIECPIMARVVVSSPLRPVFQLG